MDQTQTDHDLQESTPVLSCRPLTLDTSTPPASPTNLSSSPSAMSSSPKVVRFAPTDTIINDDETDTETTADPKKGKGSVQSHGSTPTPDLLLAVPVGTPKQFDWDMRLNPRFRPFHPQKAMGEDNLLRPTTSPSTAQFHFVITEFNCAVPVAPSTATGIVTIEDLLVAIYDFLQRPISDLKLKLDRRSSERVEAAFYERGRVLKTLEPSAKVTHFALVDVLGDRCWFNGIEHFQREQWKIHVCGRPVGRN